MCYHHNRTETGRRGDGWLRWTWDPDKNEINKLKHGISFEIAEMALRGPLSVTENDPYQSEERFRTTGTLRGTVIVIVHTLPESDDETDDELGRIISARRANRSERLRYEESRY